MPQHNPQHILDVGVWRNFNFLANFETTTFPMLSIGTLIRRTSARFCVIKAVREHKMREIVEIKEQNQERRMYRAFFEKTMWPTKSGAVEMSPAPKHKGKVSIFLMEKKRLKRWRK